ncbi:MAG: YicC/YloC family endoribonuclease [Bacillota bacterium]|nr:YicC/YloC family endoribonuclease [Bacillota bacterium]
MIKSMTGFGRSEYSDEKRSVTAEVRSVNHRYCDVSVKMPRRYSFAEETLKKAVKEILSRGKIDVSISVVNLTEDDVTVKLNTSVAEQYRSSLTELKEQFGLQDEISLELIAGLPDVMKTVPEIEDEDAITEALKIPVVEAVKKLDAMRQLEGEKLKEDLLKRREIIKEITGKIKERAPLVVEEHKQKLEDRISQLLDKSVEIPEDRLAVEVAVFADKCDITEELVRLDSHMDQMQKILGEGKQAVGKRLDFLVQEMNREANTIGSKANDLEITNYMLTIKSEVEKIREQVQNIE